MKNLKKNRLFKNFKEKEVIVINKIILGTREYEYEYEFHKDIIRIIYIVLTLRKKSIFLKCKLYNDGKIEFYSYNSRHELYFTLKEIEIYELFYDEGYKKIVKALNFIKDNIKKVEEGNCSYYDFFNPSLIYDLYFFKGDGSKRFDRVFKFYIKIFKHLTKQYPIIFEQI